MTYVQSSEMCCVCLISRACLKRLLYFVFILNFKIDQIFRQSKGNSICGTLHYKIILGSMPSHPFEKWAWHSPFPPQFPYPRAALATHPFLDRSLYDNEEQMLLYIFYDDPGYETD